MSLPASVMSDDGEKAGYRPGKVKTAEGAVDYSAPQVRDTPEPFVSGVRAALSGRTREFERLAIELYARGLSTRDMEDTFTDETGRRLLSRAAVSECPSSDDWVCLTFRAGWFDRASRR